jgi:hypothetical protein
MKNLSLSFQPWLSNRRNDLLFILAPLFLPIFFLLLFPSYFRSTSEVTTFWWVVLVLSIDVAHVYSTLFRFYWEKETFEKNKTRLIWIPIMSLIASVILHFIGAMAFWRTLAYLAVFHFVRQQYGFLRLYTRKELKTKFRVTVDNLVIYNATLYPMLYWHFYRSKDLHWFVEGDLISLPSQLGFICTWTYWVIIVIYVFTEIYHIRRTNKFNIPKNLLIVGTYLSWHLGIITFKGDLIFTMLNVIAHGVPYMALVYFRSSKSKINTVWKSALLFIGTIITLSYFEEGLWDSLIWRDHEELFSIFNSLPQVSNHWMLSVLVPLLALPQITHYILDGFIWRISEPKELNYK